MKTETVKTEVGRRAGLVVACASAPNLSKQCNRAAGRVFRSKSYFLHCFMRLDVFYLKRGERGDCADAG